MSRIEKYAKLLANLEDFGLKSSAEKLANNNGIKLLCQAEGTTARSLTPQLKKALEADLVKIEHEYKNGIFRRVDEKDLSDEEKQSAIPSQRVTDHMNQTPAGGIADLDFMKRTEPRISYK